MDKTEETVVAAVLRFRMGEFEAERGIGVLLQLQIPKLAIPFTDFEEELFVCRIDHGIQKISYRLSVDGQEEIAGFKFEFSTDTARLYRENFQHRFRFRNATTATSGSR
jgi:hypothetical protein